MADRNRYRKGEFKQATKFLPSAYRVAPAPIEPAPAPVDVEWLDALMAEHRAFMQVIGETSHTIRKAPPLPATDKRTWLARQDAMYLAGKFASGYSAYSIMRCGHED